MKRIYALSICVSMFFFIFAGCNSDSFIHSSEQPSVSVSETDSEKFLSLPYSGAVIDPLSAKNDLDQALTSLIFEQVCIINADFTTELCLAKTVKISDCVMDVTLNDGVAFHDGSVLTAEDAVYSINSICANVNSPYYGILSNTVSVVTTSVLSFRIEMSDTILNGYECLCFPVIKHGSGGRTDGIGTGAYSIHTADGNKILKAEWKDLLYPEIKLVRVDGAKTAKSFFETDKIDSMAINLQTSEKIAPICSYQTVNSSTGIAHILGFNSNSSIMKSAELRRAIGTVIPRKKLCLNVMSGSVVASNDWICPDGKLLLSADTGFSVEEAESYLKELNSVEPVKITLLYCDECWVRIDEALCLQELLENYGFDCTLIPTEPETFLADMNKNNIDLFLIRTSLFSPSDLAAICGSDGERNVFSYKNNALDTVLLSYMINDLDLQTEIGTEIESLLNADMPFTVIGYEQTVVFIRNNSMFSFSPTPGCPYGDPVDWTSETEGT